MEKLVKIIASIYTTTKGTMTNLVFLLNLGGMNYAKKECIKNVIAVLLHSLRCIDDSLIDYLDYISPEQQQSYIKP